MSEIEYTVHKDDLAAFNEYHVGNSPAAQSSIRTQRWIWSAIYAALSVFTWSTTDSWALPISLGLLAIVWPIVVPFWMAWRIRRMYLAMLAEGRNPGVSGKRLVRAEPEYLFSASGRSESRVKWDSVERVAETPSHAFIYVGATTAIVVPKAEVSRGNHSPFSRRFVNARMSPPNKTLPLTGPHRRT